MLESELLTFKPLGLYIVTNFVLISTDWIIIVPSFTKCVNIVSLKGKQAQAAPAFPVTLLLLTKPMNDVAPVSFSNSVNKAVGSIFCPRGNTEEQITRPKQINCFHKILLHKPHLHY